MARQYHSMSGWEITQSATIETAVYQVHPLRNFSKSTIRLLHRTREEMQIPQKVFKSLRWYNKEEQFHNEKKVII